MVSVSFQAQSVLVWVFMPFEGRVTIVYTRAEEDKVENKNVQTLRTRLYRNEKVCQGQNERKKKKLITPQFPKGK